ncbi:hypothetical protein MRX96_004434 [Rhipicephalus microplus]
MLGLTFSCYKLLLARPPFFFFTSREHISSVHATSITDENAPVAESIVFDALGPADPICLRLVTCSTPTSAPTDPVSPPAHVPGTMAVRNKPQTRDHLCPTFGRKLTPQARGSFVLVLQRARSSRGVWRRASPPLLLQEARDTPCGGALRPRTRSTANHLRTGTTNSRREATQSVLRSRLNDGIVYRAWHLAALAVACHIRMHVKKNARTCVTPAHEEPLVGRPVPVRTKDG